jgi:ATP-dependent DNA helicase RecG
MIVKPSVNTPVKCTGVIYVRVGPTIRLASSEHELRLTEKRQSKDLPYDLRPVNLASINELDEVLSDQYIRWFDYRFLVTAIVQEGGSEIVCNLPVRSFAVVNKDILKENSRSKIDQLKSLKLIDSTGNAPTVFGLLLCSTNATKYIPGAYIQFLRIDDTSDENIMERIIDKAEIYGTVVQQIVGIEDKFKAHNKTRYSYLITPAVTKNDYPKKAFEQAIRNAILHRTYENSNAPVRIKWYNDRIEIMSPGGPYGNVTRERFGETGLTDYRNPNLAEALSLLGYVQKFGSGLGIIRNAMSENGNPEPEFVAKETTVHVTLKSTQQPS